MLIDNMGDASDYVVYPDRGFDWFVPNQSLMSNNDKTKICATRVSLIHIVIHR